MQIAIAVMNNFAFVLFIDILAPSKKAKNQHINEPGKVRTTAVGNACLANGSES